MSSSDALQAWLSLEHESIWLYPIIGARFSDLERTARTSFAAHRDTRDALLARLRALDAEPVATRLTYAEGPLATPADARAAAQSVEARISGACLTVVGERGGGTRTFAITNVRRSALAELTWGAEPRAFPGLP